MPTVPYRPPLLPKVPSTFSPNIGEYLENLNRALDQIVRGIYSDLGTVVNWTDISASRAVDTIYQNTSGKIRHLQITVSVGDGNNIGTLQIENATPPTVTHGKFGSSAATGATLHGTIHAQVPPNWYYRLAQTAGTTTITEWLERDA